MFLDDQLYNMCQEVFPDTPEKINKLYGDLVKKCCDYYQEKIQGLRNTKYIKAQIDRTFNLWDSFITKLEKSNRKADNIMAELFKKFSFKKQFLSNPEIAELYNTL